LNTKKCKIYSCNSKNLKAWEHRVGGVGSQNKLGSNDKSGIICELGLKEFLKFVHLTFLFSDFLFVGLHKSNLIQIQIEAHSSTQSVMKLKSKYFGIVGLVHRAVVELYLLISSEFFG
jgi:hypothetical protein